MSEKAFYLILILAIAGYAECVPYRVCSVGEQGPALDGPSLTVSSPSTEVSYVKTNSRMDCAKKILNDEADLGYLTAEEILVLNELKSDGAKVVAHVAERERENDAYMFETVAVVPAGHTKGFEGLKGGSYCLSKNDFQSTWSFRVLQAFERKVAPIKDCGVNKTADELEVTAINDFFSASCRPMSANPLFDASLIKAELKNVCALCEGCKYNETIVADAAALSCLEENSKKAVPAVAYEDWRNVKKYFAGKKPEDYAILCTDGSVKNLTSLMIREEKAAPCSFIQQPWGAIVAKTEKAMDILTAMKTWWPDGVLASSETGWKADVFLIMANTDMKIKYEVAPVSVAEYTKIMVSGRVDTSIKCLSPQRFCLTPEKILDCEMISAAASSLGIQPTVTCPKEVKDTLACIADIKNGTADFVVSSSNYGYLARKHYDLEPVKMLQLSKGAQIVAVVKNDSKNSLEKLNNTNACFPEYGGLVHMAVVSQALNLSLLNKTQCSYGKAVSNFFNSTCLPGAHLESHSLPNSDINATKLCSLCESVNKNDDKCAANSSNKYYGDMGALACLDNPDVDVAFLNIQALKYNPTISASPPKQLYVLCSDNKVEKFSPAGAVADNCVLTRAISSEFISKASNAHLKNVLDYIEIYFGKLAGKSTNLISLRVLTDMQIPDATTANVVGYRKIMEIPTCSAPVDPVSTSTAAPSSATVTGSAARSVFSFSSLVLLTILSKFL